VKYAVEIWLANERNIVGMLFAAIMMGSMLNIIKFIDSAAVYTLYAICMFAMVGLYYIGILIYDLLNKEKK
jgi:hypothetical protein